MKKQEEKPMICRFTGNIIFDQKANNGIGEYKAEMVFGRDEAKVADLVKSRHNKDPGLTINFAQQAGTATLVRLGEHDLAGKVKLFMDDGASFASAQQGLKSLNEKKASVGRVVRMDPKAPALGATG